MTKITPLLRFLRALNVEQQHEFAAAVGTTRVYLYQLAGQPAPNPRLRMAMALVAESKKWGKKFMTAPLSFEDLIEGTEDEDFVTRGGSGEQS
jgi:hypothetical protein